MSAPVYHQTFQTVSGDWRGGVKKGLVYVGSGALGKLVNHGIDYVLGDSRGHAGGGIGRRRLGGGGRDRQSDVDLSSYVRNVTSAEALFEAEQDRLSRMDTWGQGTYGHEARRMAVEAEVHAAAAKLHRARVELKKAQASASAQRSYKLDSDWRRYARDHRRRQRLLRYARKSASERFIEGYGLRSLARRGVWK